MEDIKTIGTYQEFKKALDAELYNQAEGFVRTGYLLKVARDTDILRESGYASVAEFAHAEYGLTKDVVSRYIAINDRYSEGGYSEKLQEQYRGYGVAKLQEMLVLPDVIIDVMSPEMTRKEIQEVRKGYREEEENPMASLMETPKTGQENMTVLQQAVYQYLHDNKTEFTKGFDVAMRVETDREEAVNGILDAFAPSGVGIRTVRIQGTGRVIISFRGKDTEVEILSVRTQERTGYPWEKFISELREVFAPAAGESGAEAWERIYGEQYEGKKEEVAPVQPSVENMEKGQGTVQQTLHDISPEFPEPSPAETTEDNEVDAGEEPEKEEQVEGQTRIEKDFQEYMPEKREDSSQNVQEPSEPEEAPAAVMENVTDIAEIVTDETTDSRMEELREELGKKKDEILSFTGGWAGIDPWEIPPREIRTVYHSAVDLAAVLERMWMLSEREGRHGKEHHAQ